MRSRAGKIFAVVVLISWCATIVLMLYSRVEQTLFSDARNGRLIRVHIKENGVTVAIVHGFSFEDGFSVRAGRAGSPGLGIPVMYDGATYKGEVLFPGLSRGSGTGTADPSRPTLPTVRVTGADYTLVWLWPLAITTLLVAIAWPRIIRARYLRQYRAARGLCLNCGYDLRASSGACPECGDAGESAR